MLHQLSGRFLNKAIGVRKTSTLNCITAYNGQARSGRMLVMEGRGYGDSGHAPNGNKSWLGFGDSRRYLYQITTGKLWTTNNLFSTGEVPADFLPGMPDNAVTLSQE